MYRIINNTTGEHLLYAEEYDGVCWIDPDKLHKYFEESFILSWEQTEDLCSNLLKNDDITVLTLIPNK